MAVAASRPVIDLFATARTRLLSGRRLVGRAMALSVGRGLASVFSALWVILAARQLSLSEFGAVNVALALILILTSVSDFGLQFLLARDVVDTGVIRRSVFDEVIRRRLILAAAAALVMVGLYELATRDRNLAVPLIFSLSIVGAGLYNPAITGYRATGNINLEVISEIGSRIVVLAGGGLWLLAGGGIMAVAVAYSSVGIAVGVIDYLYVRGKSVAGAAAGGAPSLSLRAAAPFALANTVGAVYQRIDNYLLGLLRGTVAAGAYGASYRFQDLNMLICTALGQLALSEAAGQDPRTRLSIGKRVAAQSVLLALGPAVLFSVFAQPLLEFVFGSRYAGAAPIVVVLMISTLPAAAAIALQGLAGVTDARRFATATAGALAINVVANLILIPLFSGMGAAVANVISQAFLAAAYYWALWRRTQELATGASA
jgi:O-antigen/teichoic acid export membrane protein